MVMILVTGGSVTVAVPLGPQLGQAQDPGDPGMGVAPAGHEEAAGGQPQDPGEPGTGVAPARQEAGGVGQTHEPPGPADAPAGQLDGGEGPHEVTVAVFVIVTLSQSVRNSDPEGMWS